MGAANPNSILYTGATASDEVEGMEDRNRGMILRLKQEQPKGESGRWPKGRVYVLEAGTGTYAEYIKEFVGQTLDGKVLHDELLDRINAQRKQSLSRLTILDRNGLGIRR